MKYEVEVDYSSDNTKIIWTYNGEIHCEHGPAIWWQDGTYDFYLGGKHVFLEEWEKLTSRVWNVSTKRSTKKRRSFSGTESPKVFLITECNVNGDRRPTCTFDCLIKVDEFILENETDNTWFEWYELEVR